MISVNVMTRSEPFLPYGLAAIAPFVDEILITDTGSTQEFLQPLKELAALYNNIKLSEIECPDGHGWSRIGGETTNCDEKAGVILANVRRAQQEQSRNDVIWILDGDEVPTDRLVQYIVNDVVPIIQKSNNLECVYVPVIDLQSRNTVRQVHAMGRIFNRHKVFLRNDFPHEQHHSKKDNWPLLPGDGKTAIIEDMYGYILHLESVLKPHRKTPMDNGRFTKPLPEVFERNPQWKHLIEQYGF